MSICSHTWATRLPPCMAWNMRTSAKKLRVMAFSAFLCSNRPEETYLKRHSEEHNMSSPSNRVVHGQNTPANRLQANRIQVRLNVTVTGQQHRRGGLIRLQEAHNGVPDDRASSGAAAIRGHIVSHSHKHIQMVMRSLPQP